MPLIIKISCSKLLNTVNVLFVPAAKSKEESLLMIIGVFFILVLNFKKVFRSSCPLHERSSIISITLYSIQLSGQAELVPKGSAKSMASPPSGSTWLGRKNKAV
jgi:hypothetical protein